VKLRSSYVCQQCGYETPQWYGKCPSCDSWNSLVETVKEVGHGTKTGSFGTRRSGPPAKPVLLSDVRHIEKNRVKTGLGEFDRVMGGGIVPGSVTLLAGDPGIGKSTLVLNVLAQAGGLYVSGEESAEQVKLRAKRLGIDGANIGIIADTNVGAIAQTLGDGEDGRNLVIIDSIQTLFSDDLAGMPGSVGQIRHSAEVIIGVAKSKGIPVIIIGHVTKEGTIAGPKVLEHMVDTVLYLEGERFANARILRTLKNRFGAVEEVGIFEMNDDGLKEISNPSKTFLQDRVKNVPGSVVTVVMEGTRPILVEIQALTVPSQLSVPRRVTSGVDYNRLQLLCAILQKRLNTPLATFDVFVNVSGGLKIEEPAADLAIITAIFSSFKNIAVPSDVAVFGEVGLLGEVRSVSGLDRRIKEASRIGFGHVISPKTITHLGDLKKLLS
jgi:DNA repair protein RadA/Sms